MPRRLSQCSNVDDLRDLARRRLPGPIFHYIDGAADDEVTYRRNTRAFENYDLVPNVLAGVADIDMSVEVMGCALGLPIFCSPTALQRLFHHDGERAVARATQAAESATDGNMPLARRELCTLPAFAARVRVHDASLTADQAPQRPISVESGPGGSTAPLTRHRSSSSTSADSTETGGLRFDYQFDECVHNSPRP